MKMFFEEAVKVVETERDYQDEKWGPVDHNGHTVAGWLLLMRKELDEAELALIKGGAGRDAVMHEIAQVSALGIAAIQQHGMNVDGRSL